MTPSFSLLRSLRGSRVIIPGLLLFLGLAGCAGLPRGGESAGFPPPRLGERGILSATVHLAAEDYYRQRPFDAGPALPFELLGFTELTYTDRETGDIVLTARGFELNSPLEVYGLGLELARRETGTGLSQRGSRLWQLVASEGREDAADLLSIELDRAFGAPSPPPPEAQSLLETGAEAATLRYETLSLLGSPILVPALAGEVLLADGNRMTIFVSPRSSPEEAEDTLRRFLGSVSGEQTGISFRIGIGDVACALLLRGRTWLNLSRLGSRVAGVAGAQTPSVGWAPLTRLVATLGE